jgi:hypothetical protein
MIAPAVFDRPQNTPYCKDGVITNGLQDLPLPLKLSEVIEEVHHSANSTIEINDHDWARHLSCIADHERTELLNFLEAQGGKLVRLIRKK